MSDLRTAAQMALTAIERALSDSDPYISHCKAAADALRAALAADPQPVAWRVEWESEGWENAKWVQYHDEFDPVPESWDDDQPSRVIPLYTAAHTAQPLTEFEFSVDERDGPDWMQVAAGVCGNREDAEREAGHYAAQYAQDGDVRVTVFQRVILSRNEIGGTHG